MTFDVKKMIFLDQIMLSFTSCPFFNEKIVKTPDNGELGVGEGRGCWQCLFHFSLMSALLLVLILNNNLFEVKVN